MRLTRFTGAKDAPLTVVQPSLAHQALVDLLEDLFQHFARENHPVANLVKAMEPSLLRDLAEVDVAIVRREAAYFAERFVRVAAAGAGEAMAEEAQALESEHDDVA